MSFTGYTEDTQRFLRDLAVHNDKSWFEANRHRYEEAVRGPSMALCTALQPALADCDPPLHAEPKLNGSVRRIFRDTRFSADKAPYHDNQHLIFFTGDKPNAGPGVHVVIGANGFSYGAGHWAFSDAQLARFRTQVLSDGGAAVEQAIEESGLPMDPPALKTVPRGFDKEATAAGWLKYKGLVVRTQERLPMPRELLGPQGVDFVADICTRMLPLIRYIGAHVQGD
ncbi:DUF2461 domain-containing protein [Devosia sp.]|uniref:DUF2461 domain-containing protein n=1 Tax=Devosia sp. TaxID=1871048 RepID=UPI003A932F06